jgi:hypothetical protein
MMIILTYIAFSARKVSELTTKGDRGLGRAEEKGGLEKRMNVKALPLCPYLVSFTQESRLWLPIRKMLHPTYCPTKKSRDLT